MSNYQQRAASIIHKINTLALISEEEGCVTRTFCTKAFIEGRLLVFSWMQAIGLQTCIDAIGNLRGKLLSDHPAAKTFVIASHIDTVVNAGKWDGPLGVIMGLDLLEHLIQQKTKLPFHIQLIAFSDEEGVRFHTTFLGSKAVVGAFDNAWLDKKDKHGITLQEAVIEMGGNPSLIHEAAIPADQWLGYFEMHIEQGPVLYEKDIPVAVVTAIAGQKRVQLSFKGMAGHAGTVPMDMRQDALCCAAECINAIEQFALDNKENLVATVGKLEVHHSASNVIPGNVVCSVDIRSAEETFLSNATEKIQNMIQSIALKRQIDLHWHLVQETKPVTCDAVMTNLLSKAITQANHPLVSLVSGAGHDAVPVSEVAPVSMMFIRCYKGISHNPLENVEEKDIAAAIEVADNFIHEMVSSQF